MRDNKFFRFQEVFKAVVDCDNCPVKIQCFKQFDEVSGEDFPTCEETLFHYVETGDFLKVEKK